MNPPESQARVAINRLKTRYRTGAIFPNSGDIRDWLVTEGFMTAAEAWTGGQALKASAKRAAQLDCTARYELARDEMLVITAPVPMNRYRRSSMDTPDDVRKSRVARLRHTITRLTTDLILARAQAADTGARRDVRTEIQLEDALAKATAALAELQS